MVFINSSCLGKQHHGSGKAKQKQKNRNLESEKLDNTLSGVTRGSLK